MIAKDYINKIRAEYCGGRISYDEAKEAAQPYIAQINEMAAIIAKKHNQRPFKVSFAGLMR